MIYTHEKMDERDMEAFLYIGIGLLSSEKDSYNLADHPSTG